MKTLIRPKSNDTPIDTWFPGGGITSKGEQDKPYRSRRLNGRPAETRTPDLYRRNVDPHLIGMMGSRGKTASQEGRANSHGTNRLNGRPGRTRTVGLYRVNPQLIDLSTTYRRSQGLLTPLNACKFIQHRVGLRVGRPATLPFTSRQGSCQVSKGMRSLTPRQADLELRGIWKFAHDIGCTG